MWYQTLIQFLVNLGFRISPYDAGPLIHDQKQAYLTLYDDDCRIMGPNINNLIWLKFEISKAFEIKDVTKTARYLGVMVNTDQDGSTTLSQASYVRSILEDFKMLEANGQSTPMEHCLRIETSETNEKDRHDEFTSTRFRQGIGALQFLASSTRPDLAYSVNYL